MTQAVHRHIVSTSAAPTTSPATTDRLRARGLLTIDETADRLGVHPSTIKAWHRAGLLHVPQGQRQERATLRPARPPATRGSSNAKAGASETENPPHQPDEVHYETNALSYASPREPIETAMPGVAGGATERQADVLAALVGMMDQPWGGPAARSAIFSASTTSA